jgi:mRNA interferase MazF
MKRREVWWVSFDPSLQTEIKKTRPAVIISNNSSNKALERVQVIPLTSNTEKIFPCEALVTVKNKPHKAMADQIATVSKKRLQKKIETISEKDITDIEKAIKIQLALH